MLFHVTCPTFKYLSPKSFKHSMCRVLANNHWLNSMASWNVATWVGSLGCGSDVSTKNPTRNKCSHQPNVHQPLCQFDMSIWCYTACAKKHTFIHSGIPACNSHAWRRRRIISTWWIWMNLTLDAWKSYTTCDAWKLSTIEIMGGKEERPMDKKFGMSSFNSRGSFVARIPNFRRLVSTTFWFSRATFKLINQIHPWAQNCHVGIHELLRRKLRLWHLYSESQGSILRHSQVTSGESMASSDVICCSDLGTTRWPMYPPWGTAGIPLWMPKGITPNMTTCLAFGSPYPQSRSPDCFDIASWVSPPCPIIQRRPFKNCL